jgi:hypothetical protein
VGTIGAGPFTVTAAAKEAGIDGLRRRKGSARHTLMVAAFKAPMGLTMEAVKAVIGDQAAQALSGCLRYSYIEE